MEKGFNDDELADIMSEIETLEKEFSAADDEISQEEDDSTLQAKAVMMSESEELFENKEVHEVLDNVTELHHVKTHQPKVHSTKVSSSNSNAQTAMSFDLVGDMTMNMNFKVGGQSFQLSVNAENGLVIQMEGGASFNLPIHQSVSNKKAA
jgi:hypothetical protein